MTIYLETATAPDGDYEALGVYYNDQMRLVLVEQQKIEYMCGVPARLVRTASPLRAPVWPRRTL